MAKVVRIKNTSAAITVWDGQEIPTGTYYTLDPTELVPWSVNSTILTAIETGALVVNDGVSDLSVTNGLLFLTGGSIGFVNLETLTTTTNTVVGLLDGMTTTPPAGRYLFLFDGSVSVSNPSKIITTVFVKNTEQIGSREHTISSASDKRTIVMQNIISVNGSDIVQVHWAINSNTGSCTSRSLTYIGV